MFVVISLPRTIGIFQNLIVNDNTKIKNTHKNNNNNNINPLFCLLLNEISFYIEYRLKIQFETPVSPSVNNNLNIFSTWFLMQFNPVVSLNSSPDITSIRQNITIIQIRYLSPHESSGKFNDILEKYLLDRKLIS